MQKVIQGDNLLKLKELEDNSVDSCVTDPPYGIKFMNKKWDYSIPTVELWKEVLRVLKPGAYILVACGTKTQHRMCVNIEDAGFEIRDVICWHYASGFPKSLNVSKQIDNKLGIEREILETVRIKSGGMANWHKHTYEQGYRRKRNYGELDENIIHKTIPASTEAKQYEDWGTALKPATEFFTLARKPLSESTVAENVLKWGTGALNVGKCRIGSDKIKTVGYGNSKNNVKILKHKDDYDGEEHIGRFPANVIFDDSMAKELDNQSGERKTENGNVNVAICEISDDATQLLRRGKLISRNDHGGASRFFYVIKPSQKEKNIGLNDDEKNTHPTVKPIQLMRYLCNLITPENGIVLDPFNGSGTTGCACVIEKYNYIGFEIEEKYVNISNKRMNYYKAINDVEYFNEEFFS